jgi:hypothetical protein
MNWDLTWIWQSVLDFIVAHLPYVSPFWYWMSWGTLATFIALVMGWGFPVLRSFSAAIIFAVIAGLTGYQRGRYDEIRHREGRDGK